MMAIWFRGLCFLPTDDELFFNYLMRRLNRESLPDPDVVRDCDVYGGGDPWKIFGKDRDEKFYVFTMLKKKNKSRVDRTAGSGTWKGEQNYKIRGSQGEVVGFKKLFTFEPKASSSAEANKAENGHWIMYEYSKHPYKETECVLCVISDKYAGKVSKKVCRNLHGLVQLEEENRRAKKARPLRDDHTNAAAVDVPSTASPPTTTTTDQAQPFTSPAFDEDEVVIPQNDICSATEFPAFHGDRNANSLPPTAANIQEDTRPTASSAFGSTNAGALSTMSMSAPVVDWEWMDGLMVDMETDPVVRSDYLFYSNPFADPSEGNTNAMLASSLDVPYHQTWDPTSLHPERNVSESQVQDVPDISATMADWEWMDGLMMDMETDPVVCSDYLFNSSPFADPSESDTNAMLASSLGAPYNQTWDPTSLHRESHVAASQVHDVADILA